MHTRVRASPASSASHKPSAPAKCTPAPSALHTQARPTPLSFLRQLFTAEMSSAPELVTGSLPSSTKPPVLFRAWAPAHRRHVSVRSPHGAWTGCGFGHGFHSLPDTSVLKAGSMSVPPTAPGKAWLSEEDPTCQRLWWLRRETDPGDESSQDSLARWWVWRSWRRAERCGSIPGRGNYSDAWPSKEKVPTLSCPALSEELWAVRGV